MLIPSELASSSNCAILLTSHGIALTRQRLEIARVLFARCRHLSADQILTMVNAGGADISKATVYNTLKLFLSKALIREVIVDSGKVFYDSNTAPHHHFYDVDSGEIIDVDAAEVAVTGLPALPEGMVADGVDIIVRMRRK